MTIEETVVKWEKVNSRLRCYKAIEKELRAEIVKHIIEDEAQSGTFTKVISCKSVKVRNSINYKIDATGYDEAKDSLSEEELNCVKIGYSLDMKKYNALAPEQRGRLDDFVTSKPGAPTVDIKDIAEGAEEG